MPVEECLRIDPSARLVEWDVTASPPGVRLSVPWGVLWLGENEGGGQVVWVEAMAPFNLSIHYGGTSFFESIQPGRHRLLLTWLDRTDVWTERKA